MVTVQFDPGLPGSRRLGSGCSSGPVLGVPLGGSGPVLGVPLGQSGRLSGPLAQSLAGLPNRRSSSSTNLVSYIFLG